MTEASHGVVLDNKTYREKYDGELLLLEKTRRVCNYLSAAQIYLKENVLLKEPLKKEHLKERLLGHWGTCPGLNLIYGHCNLLIKHHDLNMFIVVGPGHGAPAILSNLFLEGSLQRYYPKYGNNEKGITELVRAFSWPGGFPSHVNSQYPGSIHEGGELGYALAVSFGAIMDNPDLIVTCVVGDGEAETGPTAGAWHSYKYIDPKESGAVIPIVHCNGFKIASETVYGAMSDEDLVSLFTGYGYQVRITEDMTDIDADMAASMEWAVQEIKKIQRAARENTPIYRPRWPVIILRTPKGWTGIKTLHGKKIEGSFRSHDIPAKDPFGDDEQFQAVSDWLSSYHIHELLNEEGGIKQEILDTYPLEKSKMGLNPSTLSIGEDLVLPSFASLEIKVDTHERGKTSSSLTKIAGDFLREVIQQNSKTFRLFSPDELESNRLGDALEGTNRNFQWCKELSNKGGRIIEMLSEHNIQGWMQGYTLTGRYALFPSYETFLGIITTMMIQYAKFIKLANETTWRPKQPSINYIQTSTLWRQEHNGFSHQNPMFTNNIANMKGKFIRIYYPPDSNCSTFLLANCLASKNRINLIVATKKEIPDFLTMEEAKVHCEAGASVWTWLGTEGGIDPDVVIVGCGNETNFEAMAAVMLLQRDCPELRLRFVNIVDIMKLEMKGDHPNSFDEAEFNALFTRDKPVVLNFHGYPSLIRQLLYGRDCDDRVQVLGYIEEGTTTTPFDMLVVNKTSRYHVAMYALKAASKHNEKVAVKMSTLIGKYKRELEEHAEYIVKYGKDPQHLENTTFFLQEMKGETSKTTSNFNPPTSSKIC